MENDDFEMLGVQKRGFVTVERTPELEAMRGIIADCFTHWPRPIPVSERLPEHGQFVLAYESLSDRWYEVMWTTRDRFIALSHSLLDGAFTHWLPLPPKPE